MTHDKKSRIEQKVASDMADDLIPGEKRRKEDKAYQDAMDYYNSRNAGRGTSYGSSSYGTYGDRYVDSYHDDEFTSGYHPKRGYSGTGVVPTHTTPYQKKVQNWADAIAQTAVECPIFPVTCHDDAGNPITVAELDTYFIETVAAYVSNIVGETMDFAGLTWTTTGKRSLEQFLRDFILNGCYAQSANGRHWYRHLREMK